MPPRPPHTPSHPTPLSLALALALVAAWCVVQATAPLTPEFTFQLYMRINLRSLQDSYPQLNRNSIKVAGWLIGAGRVPGQPAGQPARLGHAVVSSVVGGAAGPACLLVDAASGHTWRALWHPTPHPGLALPPRSGLCAARLGAVPTRTTPCPPRPPSSPCPLATHTHTFHVHAAAAARHGPCHLHGQAMLKAEGRRHSMRAPTSNGGKVKLQSEARPLARAHTHTCRHCAACPPLALGAVFMCPIGPARPCLHMPNQPCPQRGPDKRVDAVQCSAFRIPTTLR